MSKAEKLRLCREKKGLSQTDVARHLGVSKQTINKYETGIITNIPSNRLESMARLYGVNPSYIMGFEESASKDRDAYLLEKYRSHLEALEATEEEKASDIIKRTEAVKGLFPKDVDARPKRGTA